MREGGGALGELRGCCSDEDDGMRIRGTGVTKHELQGRDVVLANGKARLRLEAEHDGMLNGVMRRMRFYVTV